MKLIINILILVVLTIGVLTGIFYVWENYQKTERQYKTCLESCESMTKVYGSMTMSSGLYDLCKMDCDEEYGK